MGTKNNPKNRGKVIEKKKHNDRRKAAKTKKEQLIIDYIDTLLEEQNND